MTREQLKQAVDDMAQASDDPPTVAYYQSMFLAEIAIKLDQICGLLDRLPLEVTQ
jgi:hypothetical protein